MNGVNGPGGSLEEIVGPRHVIRDADRLATATVDWTGRFRGAADAIVRPSDTAEVAAVVAWGRRHGVAIHTQGGNTGMVGGAVPSRPGIVLSTARLDHLGDVDNGQLEAGAGATLAAVQRRADAAGWEYGVDLGARDTASIGGTVATNAGGTRVIRYGMTRRQVVGVECVTGAGEILRDMRGLAKDNTGYHLPSLLCGSEGTLAIVTEVRLGLVPRPPETAVALVPVADNHHAVALAGALAGHTAVSAIEYVRADGLVLVGEHTGTPPPFAGWPAALLVEARGGAEVVTTLSMVLAECATESSMAAAAVATTSHDRSRLWAWREGHTEALSRLGTVHKLDVSVPARHLAEFLDQIDVVVQRVRPDAQVWVFGHLADGNIHVNVSGVAPDDDAIDTAVLDAVSARDGSISAEHGIGRAKRHDLHRNRSPQELAVFARIKAAFDPDHILNPGVLLPD
ncbi:MAG: FAD-binding oxidoreductase [Acidimicrobiales bacterium]